VYLVIHTRRERREAAKQQALREARA
jgi:hypothetical protein